MNKISISLPDETLAQMDYIADRLRLHPRINRSALIQQIVYDLYMRLQPVVDDSDDVEDYLDYFV